MEKERINNIILGILGEDGEFWKESTHEYFILMIKSMNRHGYTDNEIINLLEGVYRTVSEEYGN